MGREFEGGAVQYDDYFTFSVVVVVVVVIVVVISFFLKKLKCIILLQ